MTSGWFSLPQFRELYPCLTPVRAASCCDLIAAGSRSYEGVCLIWYRNWRITTFQGRSIFLAIPQFHRSAIIFLTTLSNSPSDHKYFWSCLTTPDQPSCYPQIILFHPPTQQTIALAAEEFAILDGNFFSEGSTMLRRITLELHVSLLGAATCVPSSSSCLSCPHYNSGQAGWAREYSFEKNW